MTAIDVDVVVDGVDEMLDRRRDDLGVEKVHVGDFASTGLKAGK
jgi:hypothetical protein